MSVSMRRLVLVAVLLAASLVANGYFLFRAKGPAAMAAASTAGRSVPTDPGSLPQVASSADTAPRASVSSAILAWRGNPSAASLRELVTQLRAGGLPEHAVRATIEALASRHTRAQSDFARLPFWQQGYGGPRFNEEANAMNAARRELLAAVFGAEEFDPTDLDPIFRNVNYGNLPPAKIAALHQLERDYAEVSRAQLKGADGSAATDTFEGRLRLRLIEAERAKDVAALLTPEELRTWELRRSRAALNVIQGAKELDLTETEFAALLDLQRRHEAAIPMSAGPAETLAYLRGWTPPEEQLRQVLFGERLSTYLAATDPLYGAAAKFAQASSLTREHTDALYRLQLEAIAAFTSAEFSARATEAAPASAGDAALAPYYVRLETLLGPERARAYRPTLQRLLSGRR